MWRGGFCTLTTPTHTPRCGSVDAQAIRDLNAHSAASIRTKPGTETTARVVPPRRGYGTSSNTIVPAFRHFDMSALVRTSPGPSMSNPSVLPTRLPTQPAAWTFSRTVSRPSSTASCIADRALCASLSSTSSTSAGDANGATTPMLCRSADQRRQCGTSRACAPGARGWPCRR